MSKQTHRRRPNVLVLYTDQQRFDALAANGNPYIKTPNLDRLVASGVSFTHHCVQNPVCMPSRVSFLTGRYPSSLGITHMGVPVPESEQTIADYFGRAGYHTANIGKLHFLPHANRDHRELHPSYGFDHLEISDEPGPYEDAYHAWVRRVAPDQLDCISVGLPPTTEDWYRIMGVTDRVSHPPAGRLDFAGARPARCRADVTHTAFVAERTIDYINSHAEEAFVCVAGFYSPHSPWVAPQEYLDMYDPDTLPLPSFAAGDAARRSKTDGMYSDTQIRSATQGYYAMVSEVDHHVGRILDALERQQLLDDTIVVFTSDHGEWLGSYLRYGKGYPGNDVVMRVPLVISYPAAFTRRQPIDDAVVEAVDVLPTVLDLAGLPVPPGLQGRSMAPALRNADVIRSKTCALMEFNGWKNIRTEQYRYLIHDDGRECLFDIKNDPNELLDQADNPAYAETVGQMRHTLLQKLIQIERPKPRTWTY